MAAGRASTPCCERVAWWAEVLTIPCVGYAASLDEVEALARAGADFVAIGESIWRERDARRDRRADARARGAGAMMRRLLLLCGARAPLLAAGSARAQAPLQITPPAARPPASIPAEAGARSPKAVRQKPAAAAEADAKPVVAKSAPRSVEPKVAKPAPPPRLAPSAFAPDNRSGGAVHARPRNARRTRRSRPRCSRSPLAGAQGDVAFGAFQRGYYLEAFKEASRRASEQGDPVAMTLARRALRQRLRRREGREEGARLVLARGRPRRPAGDLRARDVPLRRARRPQDQAEAAALLDKAAKLGHVAAAYNLALLYLEGQQVRAGHRARRRAVARRGRCRQPRGAIRARDALQGRQRRRRRTRPRPRSCSAPPRAAAMSRPRSNTRSRCSTAPASRRTKAPPPRCSARPPCKGNAVAQNRLARILATGRGLPADPVAATKWHTIAKAGGASDIWLENYMQTIKDSRARGRRECRAALARARRSRAA